MVRSMVSNTSLPESFCSEALKMATYIINRVPSMAIPKNLFELWTDKEPSLAHLHIWGSPYEIRLYNPQKLKLDARIVSGYFIGYQERPKGYRFYSPNHSMRLVGVSNHVI